MLRIVLSPDAKRDIQSILSRSDEHFGAAARRRYDALIVQAMEDLAVDPTRAGVCNRPELDSTTRTYHLTNSRRHVPLATGRVRTPRHFVIFRVRDGVLHVSRLLHDSVDLKRHLPRDDEGDGDE